MEKTLEQNGKVTAEVASRSTEKGGQLRKAAEVLVELIEKQGVEYIFGLPGGAAIPIFDALVDSGVKLILTRHEQGAAHMADGYARATGKPGVVLVTSGPGATNTITGILTAHMDSVPMIVICGQQSTGSLGLDAFQEADVSGISYPLVKHSYLVKNAAEVPRIIPEAFFLARSGRPGPVLIDMPKDVSNTLIDPTEHTDFHLPGYNVPAQGDSRDIELAAVLLQQARRPVLLVGHGAVLSGAEEEVRGLAETLGIPVTNTLLGKGCFPETHELSLGMLGMHGTAYANLAVQHCDLIMSVGSRWDDRIVGKLEEFCSHARKIHVDIDPAEINKTVQVDCAVIGDARLVLQSLLPLAQPGDTADWLRQVEGWKRQHPLSYRKEGGLKAQHVIDELYRLSEGKAVVVTDVGQHQMWAAQFYRTDQRRHWQNLFYANRLSGVDLRGNPDFVQLARSYGCKAFRIRRSGYVRRVLKQALDYSDGPCIIDAEVEKEDNVFPMIPAGAGMKDTTRLSLT